jgi:hypothetical protein
MFKPTNIQTPDQIFASLNEIQAYLAEEFPADVPAEIMERAQKTSVYLAQSSKLLADAKYNFSELVGSAIMTALKEANLDRMGISTVNKYVESLAKDYKYLVDWAERSNAVATHQLDLFRSLISKLKTEIQYGHIQR